VLRTADAADAVAVAVVGSANLDLVVYAARSPEPGETVMGDDLEEHPGGKGLNQALAAALHAPTAFVGAVGSDHAADVLLAALTGAGVETSFVRRTAGKSGVAVVNLAADGENSITVIAGSNGDVTADETTRALDALQPRIVVTQLETPVSAVVAAAQWAAAEGARWVFNPSPVEQFTEAPADHPIRVVFATADPLIVNAGEGKSILRMFGAPSDDVSEVVKMLSALVTSVVLTDGSRGAYVSDESGAHFVPATPVDAVDTTGAGDSFAGTLAARLVAGSTLAEAAASASAAASATVAVARSDR